MFVGPTASQEFRYFRRSLVLKLLYCADLPTSYVLADYLTPQVIQDARGVSGGPKVATAVPCLEDTPWLTDSDDSELPRATHLQELPPFPGNKCIGWQITYARVLRCESSDGCGVYCRLSKTLFPSHK